MELTPWTKFLTTAMPVAFLLITACGGGDLEPSSVAPDTTESDAVTAGTNPFADSEAACQLVTEGEVLDLTSGVSASRWISADESSCLYGMVSPVGIEMVAISVAIPSDPDAFDLLMECARSAWGEENLHEMEDLGEGGFGVLLPNSGALVHFVSGDVILGIGVISSLRSPDEAFETATEIAHIANGVIATGEAALADGRTWPPPECG